MRIEGQRRTGTIGNRTGTDRTSGGDDFRPAGLETPSRANMAAPIAATTSVYALLALQAVGGATERRRRAVRRGFDLIESLEQMQRSLLMGDLDADHLDRIRGQLQTIEAADEPALAALIADIELRVSVELAKRGRF